MKIKGKNYRKKGGFFMPSGRNKVCYICKQLDIESKSSIKDEIYSHHILGHRKGDIIYLCNGHHNLVDSLDGCDNCIIRDSCNKEKFKKCWRNAYPIYKRLNDYKEIKEEEKNKPLIPSVFLETEIPIDEGYLLLDTYCCEDYINTTSYYYINKDKWTCLI